MEIDMEQQAVLQRMLGNAKVIFERHGAYFASKRTPEMDALVSAGALRVQESVEVWGPCVTYVVTDDARKAMARLALRADQSPATTSRMFCYPVSDGETIAVEIMGADGRHTPDDALWIGERIIRTAKSCLPDHQNGGDKPCP